jgi:hypothetical protein
MSTEFTPSSIMLKLMNGIPQIVNIVSQEQLVGSMMPEIIIVACKCRTEAKPSKKRNHK